MADLSEERGQQDKELNGLSLCLIVNNACRRLNFAARYKKESKKHEKGHLISVYFAEFWEIGLFAVTLSRHLTGRTVIFFYHLFNK